MKGRVEVFVITAANGPNGMPQPGGEREVEASTTDALRSVTHQRRRDDRC